MYDPKYQRAYLDHHRTALENKFQPLSVMEFIRLLDELNAW